MISSSFFLSSEPYYTMAENPMQNHDAAYTIPIQTTINPPPLSHTIPIQTTINPPPFSHTILIQTTINPPPLSHSIHYVEDDDNDVDDDEYFKRIPLGYRFRPSDVQLINEYLLKKINNQRLPRSRIHEVKLYGSEPESLVEKFKPSGENEWYFFTPRDKKYKNGTRPNRAAGYGYWKATGADKIIVHNGVKIGFRKSLLYYKGEAMKGERTAWLMNEYRVVNSTTTSPQTADQNDMKLDDWVLCRIYINPKALSNGSQTGKPAKNVQENKNQCEGGMCCRRTDESDSSVVNCIL